MTTGTIAPSPWFTGLDDAGDPIVGGLVYVYAAGTTTPIDTWSAADLTDPNLNSNPVVLDAAGRATMFLSPNASYKFVLRTSAGVLVRTADNIASVGSGGSGAATEILYLGGDPTSPIVLTSYPSGATYDKLHAGSVILSIDSADLVGVYVIECMALGSGGTVSAALVNLDDAPDTPIVAATSSSATGQRVQSSAITFATPGSAKNYGLKVKVSAGFGNVWGARIVRV